MFKYGSYIIFLLLSILVGILYINDFGPLHSLQRSVNDNLFSLTASDEPMPNVVIVSIDGAAQSKFGPWPWNHDLLADLTAAIAGGEPKVIVLDCDLNEDAQQEASGKTRILAEQLDWMDNLVLPYDIAPGSFRSSRTSNPDHLFHYSVTIDNKLGVMTEESSLLANKVFLPANRILETEPYLGFNYIMPDDDRILRHQPMLVNFEGYYYPSLPLIAAAVYLGVPAVQIKVVENEAILIGNENPIPISGRSEFLVNFYKENPFTKYSAGQILDDGFNFSNLKGKAVIVSVDDFTYTEYFQTPVNNETPKQVITANVISNIINKDIVVRGFNSTMLNLLVLFLLGGLFAFIMPQIQLLYRFVTLGIGLFILVNVSYFMMSSFNVLVELVYVGMELILFMVASFMLESSLVLGDQVEAIKKKREKDKFKKRQQKAKSSDGHEAAPRVREIRGSSSDPENLSTKAVDEQFAASIKMRNADEGAGDIAPVETNQMNDHQSLNLNDYKTPKPKSGFKPSPSTMIGGHKKNADATGLPGSIADDEPEIIKPNKFEDADSGSIAEAGADSEMALDDSDLGFNASPLPTELKKLGRYQVSGILGRGAMGQVYKGIDPAINRPVALKTIRLDFVSDPNEMAELKERLHREAHAAGKLSHPNIVTIYDVGSEGDLQYIAMEFLEGRTLESMIKKKTKFNYRIISQIIVQICAALDYAHQQGIVHRDIKPANIMISTDYRVKVMDFGIARVDSNSMTKTGIAMGTPNYIAPEQLKGQSVDARADLFSLGVVMYEMLLGKRPFKGENITSLIYSIVNHEPEKPSTVNPQIPLLFDHIIGKALKKKPQERYQRATELVSDLSDFVESFSGRRR